MYFNQWTGQIASNYCICILIITEIRKELCLRRAWRKSSGFLMRSAVGGYEDGLCNERRR